MSRRDIRRIRVAIKPVKGVTEAPDRRHSTVSEHEPFSSGLKTRAPQGDPKTRALSGLREFWQGWKESNLRMPESKSGALTNLATPLHRSTAETATNPLIVHLATHAMAVILPTGQRMRLQVAALADLPVAGGDCEFHLVRQMRKNRTSRASHAPLKALHGEPVE